MTLIEKLDLPSDLKNLSLSELYELAGEIRSDIIKVIAKNGGHLASNLGVVELTLAIHASLRSPEDKIIWDVGHQSYTHKILTGRYKQFPTIRQYKGLSGFIKREESVHDIFGAGHAATSISAALGIAKARDLKGEKFAVVAVIGDSSISSGEAFEAINNIKTTVKGPFIIILNDNKMSISHPVGVLSEHITSLRYNPFYRKAKKEVERLLLKLPQIGKPLVKSIDKLLMRTKHLLINYEKSGVIYEEFGIRYLGPIEAGNIPHIMGAIRYAKTAREPVLIHVLSTKGKGYKPAEEDPTMYHGLGEFDPETGLELKKKITATYTEVFGKHLVKMARNDEKIVAITAAMAEGTGLSEFQSVFPERCVDVGIAEEHAVTFAGGLAVQGFKPFVAIYSTFMQRAYDQILHDIALQNLPVIFCMDRAGLVGEDGPTHHGVFDYNFMRMIPNMTVMAPRDGEQLKAMLEFAAGSDRGPIAIRYPKGCVPVTQISLKSSKIIYGKSELLVSSPKSLVAIVAIGSMVMPAYELIQKEKLNVKLIDARFLKPLDKGLLKKELSGCKHVITLEEGVKQGGLYSAIAEWLDEQQLNIGLAGCGLDYTGFVTHGSRDILLKNAGLDKDSLKETILKTLRS
ncbi:MAG: 1-deoxy-D-xylulose-5-phosphate synthase [Candidatus Margulisbacteria bacterium]|nr:1-deoxy-D-xylulose-5-phosphate synthase [Candidatus Margulisiibacteriota bacterium]